MTYVTLLHILSLLFVLFLFRVISNLLDKLVMLQRQLNLMTESRNNWWNIAILRTEKKP